MSGHWVTKRRVFYYIVAGLKSLWRKQVGYMWERVSELLPQATNNSQDMIAYPPPSFNSLSIDLDNFFIVSPSGFFTCTLPHI